MRDQAEHTRVGKPLGKSSQGPKLKRCRDAAVAEQRVQVALLHRRRQQLLEQVAKEERQFAALKQQVEGLALRWQESCAVNQQLHHDNLHLHEQLERAARAHGLTLNNAANSTSRPPRVGPTHLNPYTTPVAVSGTSALHRHPSSYSLSEPVMQLAPHPRPAAAPYGDPFRHPVAAQACGLPPVSSRHGRCAPAIVLDMPMSHPPAGLPAYEAALLPLAPAAAAASFGGAEPSTQLSRSYSSSSTLGPLAPAGAAWQDAYSQACGRGVSPASSSRLTPAPYTGCVEGIGSNTLLSPLADARQSPFSPVPAAAAAAAAAAAPAPTALGVLYTPAWPAAQGAALAAAPCGDLAPMQVADACGFGALQGPAQHAPAGGLVQSMTEPLPQQAGGAFRYIQGIIPHMSLPGDLDMDTDLLLLEAPSANATVTRKLQGSGKGCHPGSLPGSCSKVDLVTAGGAAAAAGDSWLQDLDPWPSHGSAMSNAVLGVPSPGTSSPVLAGGSQGSAQQQCCVVPALPAAAAAAAAPEDTLMVGPAEVDNLLNSLLEEEDPIWLTILGGEGV